MVEINKGVIVVVIIGTSAYDCMVFSSGEVEQCGCTVKYVYNEQSARELGLLKLNDDKVQFIETRAYKINRDAEIDEILSEFRDAGRQGLQFVTVDGTVYPCDCVQPYLCRGFVVGLTLTLSYGFTVDVQSCHLSYDVKHRYNTIYRGKVVRCE